MKFILDKDTLTIEENKFYNSGSVDYYEAEIQFDETWNDLTIEAIITKMGENKGISRSPINNELMLDIQEFGTYTIGFVGYKIENEEKIYQISTDLGVIQYNQGAGEIETENEPIPTVTEWEIYIAQIQDMIDNIEDMDITAEKNGKQTTITITKKDGTIQEVVINDGQDGKDGQDGQDGKDGQDAKINGKNSIEIEAGNNLTIDDTENGIRINSIGTSNYNDLSNKPKINNVELSGNKSLNDLGIQPKGNYLISETDPTVPSYVKNITQTNITNWNNKSDFSGSYNDLSNKPTIPDELKDLTDDSTHRTVTDTEKTTWNNKAEVSDIPDVSNFITKNVNNLTNYTLKTNTGSLIDLEINDTTYVVTLKLKNQDGNVISTDTIDLPLESVVVSGRYDNATKKVILTLENGSEVDFSVADLVAGLQTEITSQNKLASDLVDDTNSGNKFVTTSEKQTWNNKYDKPNGGIPKTDLASDVQTSLGKADTALQEHQDISGKQDIEDNTLTTNNKTVPTAINEVNSIAKGANQALSYGNYSTMITAFNSLANNVYNVGQNVMIITLQVPDLWISGIESTSQTYTYTTDEAFTTELSTNGYVQVGYYKLSALETQKVDLTNYVTFDDYATSTTPGVVITNSNFGVSTSSYTKNITAVTKTYAQYRNGNNAMFVGKGTLENVITGKELDLKQLSTFDSTKTQVLKNINGTLTWVDE